VKFLIIRVLRYNDVVVDQSLDDNAINKIAKLSLNTQSYPPNPQMELWSNDV
jgi:hypothetical protein